MQFLSRLLLFVVFFSVTILISKLEVQSHRKKCLCLVCQDATKDKKTNKNKKKALHIYIKKFGATFFWQSSQSSYMSVSRLSFLVICDMISDLLIPSVQI